jgi:hypothetical protein
MRLIFLLAFGLFVLIGWWRLFRKAGRPGILAAIPVLNLVTLIDIAGRPKWWLFLYLLPLVNVAVAIIVGAELAERFGKGRYYGLGIAFLPPVFIPLLGYGSAHYRRF